MVVHKVCRVKVSLRFEVYEGRIQLKGRELPVVSNLYCRISEKVDAIKYR